ncbi:hypothetical protein [Alysiella crassa]|uniref:hypothetical protein n=2 Tax=Alysiella crassa TaxID=153491 RepID=UPI000A862638
MWRILRHFRQPEKIKESENTMLTLFALKQSRAYRIAWLLELLGVDYQAETLERDPTANSRPKVCATFTRSANRP